VPYGKRCGRCGEFKELQAFPKNKNKRDGRHSNCKPCHIAQTRESFERLFGSWKNYLIEYRYGASEDDVKSLLEKQEQQCAICRQPRPTHIDHNHSTGRLRGILCFNCNRLIGYADDDTAWFRKAIAYLDQHTAGAGGVREDPAPYIILSA
jgi:hypothetical protein